MAIVRTVLSPTNLIQPQHGLTQYETDMDTNMSILNTLLSSSGVSLVTDLGWNGVYSGLTLSTSASLTPGLATGVLYAQGTRYAPATPAPGPAPASATNYLFYNSSSGFYYQTSPVGATSGDALIGSVTASGVAITAVVQGTRCFGSLSVSGLSSGNNTVPHLLGRAPTLATVLMTSTDVISWQSTPWDGTNLYIVASNSTATALVYLR